MAYKTTNTIIPHPNCQLWSKTLAELQVAVKISRMTAHRLKQGYPASAETIANVLIGTEYTFDEAFMVYTVNPGGPYAVPPGYKLVPVDADDEPELSENKPVLMQTHVAVVPVPNMDKLELPIRYEEASEDERFKHGMVPNDNAIPDEEVALNPELGREAYILLTVDGARLYAIEGDDTIRTWKAVRGTPWQDSVVEAIMRRFDLTPDEVLANLNAGMFTVRRVEAIKRKRES